MKKLLLINSLLLLMGCKSLSVHRITDVYVEKESRRALRHMLFHTGDIRVLSVEKEGIQVEQTAEQIISVRNDRIRNPRGCAVLRFTIQETPLLKEYEHLNAVTVIIEIETNHPVASIFFAEETKNSLTSEAYTYAVLNHCISKL